MKAAVVHDTLNPCGGAERLALYSIRALWEAGFKVDLVTVEKTTWNKVKAIVGKEFRNYINNEIVLPPLRKLPTVYGRYLEWFLRDIVGFTLKLRKRYDLIMITKQLAVPVYGDIIYMHFPDFYPGAEDLYYPERYVYNTFLRIYAMPSKAISRALIDLFKRSECRPLILTNSVFAKSMIGRWLDVNAVVIYPPVEVEKYVPMAKNVEREDLVVTLGRIEKSKNQHIIPILAKNTPGIKYAIIGTICQFSYFQQITKLIKTLGIENRVKLLTNLDESTKVRLISKAKAYLHTMKYEHFGISVVEAMAAGTIPIVHKYSGSWIDIVSKFKEGFRYSYIDHDECMNAVLNAIADWNPTMSEELSMLATHFSYSNFKNKLLLVIRSLQKMQEIYWGPKTS